jgi:hypothetical protein
MRLIFIHSKKEKIVSFPEWMNINLINLHQPLSTFINLNNNQQRFDREFQNIHCDILKLGF